MVSPSCREPSVPDLFRGPRPPAAGPGGVKAGDEVATDEVGLALRPPGLAATLARPQTSQTYEGGHLRPLPTARALALAHALALALAHARAHARAHALAHALARARARAHAPHAPAHAPAQAPRRSRGAWTQPAYLCSRFTYVPMT